MARLSKEDWFRQRLAGEAARGLYSPDSSVARYLAGKPAPAKKSAKPLADLNKQLDKQVKAAINEALNKYGPTRGEIDKAAKEGKTLVANTPSRCFSDVHFRHGVCTAVFAKDNYVWEQPMSTAEFLDFAQSDSLGQYWNEEWGK
jgi:hypothetical protein